MGIAKDRCMETTTTTGTGDITLAGAVTGYRTLASVLPLSRFVSICIEAVDANGIPSGDWEVSQGYLSGSTTLVRHIVRASSNSDALVNFAAGTKRVFLTFSAFQLQDKSQIFTTTLYLAMN